jgi:hypothetical protein
MAKMAMDYSFDIRYLFSTNKFARGGDGTLKNL